MGASPVGRRHRAAAAGYGRASGPMRPGVQAGSNVMTTSTSSTPGILPTACRTHSVIASWSGQPSVVSVIVTRTRPPSIRTS